MGNKRGLVAICLASYNGEKYISEQIESIIQQSYQNWHLYVRDDGSSDGTLTIVDSYERKYPDRISVIKGVVGGGNSQSNFLAILKWVTDNVDPDYFMLSDQDDFWLPNKIEITVNSIRELNQPALIHSDLKVVSEDLKTVNNSFMNYSKLNAKRTGLNYLLIQNNITGCTMLWNRQLNKLLNYNLSDMIMHDWWIALVAATFGQIRYVAQPTILYRQHGDNVVGAKRVGSISYIKDKILNLKNINIGLENTFYQANKFKEQYQNYMTKNKIEVIDNYLNLQKVGKIKKIKICLKKKYLKQSFIQIIGEFIFI